MRPAAAPDNCAHASANANFHVNVAISQWRASVARHQPTPPRLHCNYRYRFPKPLYMNQIFIALVSINDPVHIVYGAYVPTLGTILLA